MKRLSIKTMSLALMIAAGFASSASAGLLFQSIPDLTAAPALNAWCSSCGGTFRVFDTFTLGSSSAISRFDFDVQTNYFFPTTVDVSVWTVSGGLPGVQLWTQSFTPAQFTSVFNTSSNTSVVSVTPAALALTGGTFDISIYNAQNLGVPGYAGGSGLLYQQDSGFHQGYTAGFALFGNATPVAEPSTLMLLIAGLAGLGALRRGSLVPRKAAS